MTPRAVKPLVIRFGRIGDMVLQIPLLHQLRARYGAPCGLLSFGGWSSQLFAADPDIDPVCDLRTRHRPLLASLERRQALAMLRLHDGPIYVSEDVPKHVARIRALLDAAAIEPDRVLHFSDSPVEHAHWVDRLLKFGAATPPAYARDFPNAVPSVVETAPRLFIDETCRRDVIAWRQAHAPGGPLVLLQIANKRSVRWNGVRRDDDKAWPDENWIELMRFVRVTLPAARIILCGAPKETRMLRALARKVGNSVTLATQDMSLGRLAALMATAHSVISVDTGPAHIAAAVGCPLVVMYGAESSKLWSRRSPFGRPIYELGGEKVGGNVASIGTGDVKQAWKQIVRMDRSDFSISQDSDNSLYKPRKSG